MHRASWPSRRGSLDGVGSGADWRGARRVRPDLDSPFRSSAPGNQGLSVTLHGPANLDEERQRREAGSRCEDAGRFVMRFFGSRGTRLPEGHRMPGTDLDRDAVASCDRHEPRGYGRAQQQSGQEQPESQLPARPQPVHRPWHDPSLGRRRSARHPYLFGGYCLLCTGFQTCRATRRWLPPRILRIASSG